MKTKQILKYWRINKLLLILVLIVANFILPAATCFSQAWTQKADFGGGDRYGAVGFTIGSKIYMGLGNYAGSFKKDFWEYDPASDTWTQKADFGGAARAGAIGFSIGTKGYIGTGFDGSSYKDFWEYDPASDTWTQKADFGGAARRKAVGFSIGSKGYIGTGLGDTNCTKDFWEYDPASDTWTQKADFGGTAREGATGFSIGTKGYIGTGYFFDGTSYRYKDFWEYDTITDLWTQKEDFAGTARNGATGFSINSKGYIGTGYDGWERYDFWEYNAATDTWSQKADFGGTSRFMAIGFSIDNIGYIGTGNYVILSQPYFLNDFWEYKPDDDTTALNEIEEQHLKIQIYPNPSNGVFKIQYNLSGNTHLLVEIFNIYGQLVKNDLFNNLSGYHELIINAEGLDSGIYLVKLSSDTLNKALKIVIRK
ncbi:MAG TPA: kelch repeat-containing protein [Bacteroidales bacterium]|nr:kelch repeat-containing protein [Bacteroidales bacterium]